jgi:hypothetical protein
MAKNVKHKLEESINLVMQLEALDFKNIKPYTKTGDSYETPIGKVGLEVSEMDEEDLENLKFPQIVQQSLQFYQNKPGANTTIYNVGYDVEGTTTQYAKTSYKELVKILYTVMIAVKEFIEKEKPFAITLFSTPKDEAVVKSNPLADDPQKMNLYKYIVASNLPSGYTIADTTFIRKKGVIIYRKTLNK